MKILLATGASGGHILPALVTAHELKQRGHSVVFGGVLKQAGAKIQLAGFESFEISAQGFSTRSLKTMIVFFGRVIKSLIESSRILNQVKPDCVVGFGGYGAFSLVMVAVLQRIPTMIQEQNVVPGKANRILSLFVKKIAVGFQSAQSHFAAKKVLLTGCPCRVLVQNLDRQSILAEFGLSEGMPILVVLGGSQGSHRINQEFTQCVGELHAKFAFGVIHLCGQKDVEQCKAIYQEASVKHWVASFTDEMDKVYAVADLVISRAGAMTVTELAAMALPAILIPYPYAGGHQRENALVLTQTKASRFINENDLTPNVLAQQIFEMLSRPMAKADIIKSYIGIYRPDAAIHLADAVERLKT